MKKAISILTFSIILLFAFSAVAADKVVVIPMNSGKKATSNAVAADVLEGKTFSSVDGTGLTGTRPVSPVPKTGQTTSHETGDDGDKGMGATASGDRFTDNGNGTVTDNLTGLVWLKNANCASTTKNWSDSLLFANTLYDGWTGDGSGRDCDLSDGSVAGDWRLPNVKELQSLIDYNFYNPALSNTAGTGKWIEGDPFFGVMLSGGYWSSSSIEDSVASGAWLVYLYIGAVDNTGYAGSNYVWPVRGGQ